jgi:ankyrin repeat protein
VASAERGDIAALDALLRTDREPDVRDHCDWTPLMKAALNGHLEAADRLLAAGAQVDAQDKGGYTALLLAASNNHVPMVERLLAQGAMVDHQERTQGWTALIWAAKQDHEQTVEALIHHRADPTLKDFSGRTAADWAREAGHAGLLNVLETARARSSGPHP